MLDSKKDIEGCIRAFGFPFVLKDPKGSGGLAVSIVHSESDIDRFLSDLSRESCSGIIAQEYIEGKVGTTTFLAMKGECLACVSSEKYIAFHDGTGPSAIRRYLDLLESEVAASRMSELAGLSGITGFDWMLDGQGRCLVIDPHIGRCPTDVAFSGIVGVEFGEAILRRLKGLENNFPRSKLDGRIIAPFPQILELVLSGGLRQLLKKAPLFSNEVTYFFGPLSEWKLSLVVAHRYLEGAIRVFLGKLKRRLMD